MDAAFNICSISSLLLRLRADNKGGGEMYCSICLELLVCDVSAAHGPASKSMSSTMTRRSPVHQSGILEISVLAIMQAVRCWLDPSSW